MASADATEAPVDGVISSERIETPRLVLRPPVFDDGPGVHALLSDPVACRFSPHRCVADPMITQFLIVEWHERRAAGLRTFVVTPAGASRRCIGLLSVTADQELGGMLSPNESGRGLASEALRAVIEALRLDGAWTIIDAENTPLIQMLEKAGMRIEQRLAAHRVHPQISDRKRDCALLRQASV